MPGKFRLISAPLRGAPPLILAALLALGASGPAPRSPAPAAQPRSELAAVLDAFDSLMEAGAAGRPGAFDRARALCTGGALRMFPFLAMAQSKVAGLVDTSRSEDDNLEEKIAGDWGYVKVGSHVVFKTPFLGQKEMRTVQAVHLHRSGKAWLIAEFEELESADSPVRLRSGRPAADTARAAAGSAESFAAIFPVSPRAPDPPVDGDSIRYRLRLKNGAPLAEACPLDAGQALERAVSASEWILKNRRALPVPARARESARAPEGAAGKAPDSLSAYLGSSSWLDLSDSLLLATVARIAPAGAGPEAAAGDIYRWVHANFRFSLGAVLFGASRDVLRGMTGDCSEAAVLTAALLRAAGIPSRVALGYASVGRGVFIGHAWTEAWLGRWVGVDAALGQYPAGVERIKLAALDGRADMRIAATNLMLASLSNLEVEILAVWKDGRQVPLKRIKGNAGEGVEFFQRILKGMDKGAEEGG